MLLFPAGSTPDEINDVIAELPDQDSPITVIVGDTVVEDKVAPSETMVEPEQVQDITEPLTADDLPPALENLTDTVIIPIVTNDNPEVIDILQDTILPQTENVKLQPIQVGELDKPIELKPEIDVPSELTKQKPEKKNTTVVMLPEDTKVEDIPSIISKLPTAENVTVYVGPVKVVDEVTPEDIEENLPTAEDLTEKIDDANASNDTVKDVIDKLDNENVIAIIDKPEIADSFTDAGDDNTFTPIVLGDIDVSDAIDVNATKPIVVDTIDKVDEVEEEIKASQGKDVKLTLSTSNLICNRRFVNKDSRYKFRHFKIENAIIFFVSDIKRQVRSFLNDNVCSML